MASLILSSFRFMIDSVVKGHFLLFSEQFDVEFGLEIDSPSNSNRSLIFVLMVASDGIVNIIEKNRINIPNNPNATRGTIIGYISSPGDTISKTFLVSAEKLGWWNIEEKFLSVRYEIRTC